MEYCYLGNTNLQVSKICFGTLSVGPVQSNLPLEKGAEVLSYGMDRGINFFDTAQLYETYSYIRRAMEISRKYDIIIASKTYAYTRQLAVDAVEQARKELNRDYIDIFLLHEQESIYTLEGHKEALEYLFECKEKGIVKAVGASMHHVAAVHGAVKKGLDVIHPIINLNGLGIVDGTRENMEDAIKTAYQNDMGVYSMKALGGGNLFKKASECLRYITELDYIHSVAIGMQNVHEVDANISFFENKAFTEDAIIKLNSKKRKIHIDDWCTKCGTCVKRCGQHAMYIGENTAECDVDKCVLCGYCGTVCPEWAIKVL